MTAKRKYSVKTLEELRRYAAIRGLELVEAKPNELLLDIDAHWPDPVTPTFEKWKEEHYEVLELIDERFLLILPIERWPSWNGGLHIRIRLDEPPTSIPSMIALQAVLGSDPIRETLAIYENEALLEKGVFEDTRSLFRPKAKE